MCKVGMQSNQEIIMVVPSGVGPVGGDGAGRAQAPREPPPPYSEQPPGHVRETIILQPPLKTRPIFYPCPNCYKRVMTRVEHVNTRKTHMIAGFICGFTCWCFLCCLAAVPYCLPTFKRVEHYCTECNIFLGDYSR